MSDTFQRVKEVVVKELSVDESQVTLEASFTGDLNADSIGMVELVMKLEDAFNVTIPDEDAEKIKTVGQVVEYIESHSK